MFSLNVMAILEDKKRVVLSFGYNLITTGAVISFSPPVGATMFAQEDKNMIKTEYLSRFFLKHIDQA